MSKRHLVSVIAAGCLSRFRGGVQFTQTPKEILVDDSELAVLQADSYLKVKVLSDDATTEGVAVNPAITAHTGTGTAAFNAADTNDDEGPDVSEQSGERLDVIVNDPAMTTDAGTGTAVFNPADTNDPKSPNVSAKPDDHLADTVSAVRALNLDVTGDKPTVKALKELGLDLSAKERDAVWNVLVKEHAKSQA